MNYEEEMTPEEQAAHEEAELQRESVLSALVSSLEAKRQDAVKNRSAVDSRMLEAVKQFHGLHSKTADAKAKGGGEQSSSVDSRTPSEDNITRRLTLLTSARWENMIFPTSDRNYSIEPTSIPEDGDPSKPVMNEMGAQVQMAGPDGQPKPMTEADLAAIEKAEIEARAAKMQKYIDDDLSECHFAAEGRLAIFDACQLGTGILMGPFVQATTKKKRTRTEGQDPVTGEPFVRWDITAVIENKAQVERVDPWDFYPQRARKIDESEWAFRLRLSTKAQMQALAKQPKFDAEAINEILDKEPEPVELTGSGMQAKDSVLGLSAEAYKERYAVWIYHGPFPKDVLKLMDPESCEDNLTDVSGEVWMCQGKVLKACRTHLDGQKKLPFHVINYEKDPNDVFGFGVPWVIRHSQNGVHTLWDSMMVNGILSSGTILAILKGALQQREGGTLEIGTKPLEVVLIDEENLPSLDARAAIQAITVPSTIQSTMPLYERAKQNGEEQTMMPFIAQGDQNKAFGTAFGAGMMANVQNIAQRRFATMTDAEWITPIVEMMYDHHMMYNPDESCKGDFSVKARGVSHLLAKELQAWNVQQAMQIAADPRFAPYVENYELLSMAFKLMELPSDSVLKDKKQAEAQMAQQQPPEDPRVTAAKINAQIKQAEFEAELQRVQLQGQIDLQLGEMKLVEAQMKVAADEKISLADVEAKFNVAKMREESNRLAETLKAADRKADRGAKVTLEAEKIAQSERKVALQAAKERPFRI